MKHGTFIADLAYEVEDYAKNYNRVGALLYFRGAQPSAKVRLDQMFPHGKKLIGLFLKDAKVVQDKFGDEAPMVEGDCFVRMYGGKFKVGHIHSSQNEVGDTMYFMIFTVDASLFFRAHNRIFGKHLTEVWIECALD